MDRFILKLGSIQIFKNFMFSLISITVMSKINFIANHFRSMEEIFQQLNFFTN
jgi:hypothetical protein